MKLPLAVYLLPSLLLPAQGQVAPGPAALPSDEQLQQAVTEGVQYFEQRALQNLEATRTLQAAIETGNLTGLSPPDQIPLTTHDNAFFRLQQYELLCRSTGGLRRKPGVV